MLRGPTGEVAIHGPFFQGKHSRSAPRPYERLTIDRTVTGSEPIVVEGTVRGKIEISSDLRIGTKARVEAALHARNVTVEGKVTGDISAVDRLELVATSIVEGNLKAPKIIVAEGAKFRGSVDMGAPRPKENADPAKVK
jgi:cytoskeletal protein CcmA (bactofilin family)